MKITTTLIISILAAIQAQAQTVANKTISVVINKNLMQEPEIKEHLLAPSEQIIIKTKSSDVIVDIKNPTPKTSSLIDILKKNNLLKENHIDSDFKSPACEPGGACDGDTKNIPQ